MHVLMFLLGIGLGDTVKLYAYNFGFSKYYYPILAVCRYVDDVNGIRIFTEEQTIDRSKLQSMKVIGFKGYDDVPYFVLLLPDSPYVWYYRGDERSLYVYDHKWNLSPTAMDYHLDGSKVWVIVSNWGVGKGVYWVDKISSGLNWKRKGGLGSNKIRAVCISPRKETSDFLAYAVAYIEKTVIDSYKLDTTVLIHPDTVVVGTLEVAEVDTYTLVDTVSYYTHVERCEMLYSSNLRSSWSLVDTDTSVIPIYDIHFYYLCGDTVDKNVIYASTNKGIYKWDGNLYQWIDLSFPESTVVKKLAINSTYGLFALTEEGDLWEYKGSWEHVLSAVRDIYLGKNEIYVATPTGIKKFVGDGNWEVIDEGLSDWGYLRCLKDCYGIACADDKLFMLSYGGFGYYDSIWYEANKNSPYYTSYITNSEVCTVAAYFPNVRDVIVDFFNRSLPDVNNDGFVDIVIMDISRYYTTYKGSEKEFDLRAYFDSINMHSVSEIDTSAYKTNFSDMIYVDCVPFDLSSSDDAWYALYEGLYDMMQWVVDRDEERWVRDGCKEWLKFKLGKRGNSVTILNGNSLIEWGGAIMDFESDYSFAFIYYIYEKLLNRNDEFVKELAAEPLNGIEGLQTVLLRYGCDEAFADIMKDFALTVYFDGVEGFMDNKYNLEDIDLSVAPVLENWDSKVCEIDLEPFAPYYMYSYQGYGGAYGANKDNMGNPLVFNGEDKGSYYVFVSKERRPWLETPLDTSKIIEFERLCLNKMQIGFADISEFLEDTPSCSVFTVILLNVDKSALARKIVITFDTLPPDFSSLIVYQNVYGLKNLDIYVFSSESLYVSDIIAESAVVDIYKGDSLLQSLKCPYFGYDAFSGYYIYSSTYTLPGEGTYYLILSGRDVASVPLRPETVQVSVVYKSKGRKITLNGCDVEVLSNGDGYLLISSILPEKYSKVYGVKCSDVSPVYIVGKKGEPLGCRILMSYPASDVGLYRLQGDKWVYVNGYYDESKGKSCAIIDKGGIYQFRRKVSSVETYFYCQPVPANDYLWVYYGGYGGRMVKIRLYDINGRLVRELNLMNRVNGEKCYRLDVRDLYSGCYILVFENGSYKVRRKIVIIK